MEALFLFLIPIDAATMPNEKIQMLERLNDVVQIAILSVVAALLRIMFSRGASFRDTVFMFLGGILLGSLVGWLIRDVEFLKSLRDVIVCICAIAGKEITVFVVSDSTVIFRDYLRKRLGISKTETDIKTPENESPNNI